MAGNSFGEHLPLHHLGRKPRAGDRLRRRRRAAAHAARRAGHPALARPAQARPVALHDAAARERPGQDPLRRLRGPDHRHADPAADRERGRALQGLRRIADSFRPGHADYTYWKKYGIRDYRGGGRASARETASRVAAGAVARKILGDQHRHSRRPHPDGPARHRPQPLGLGRPSTTIPSGAPTDRRRSSGRAFSTACARPAPRPAP